MIETRITVHGGFAYIGGSCYISPTKQGVHDAEDMALELLRWVEEVRSKTAVKHYCEMCGDELLYNETAVCSVFGCHKSGIKKEVWYTFAGDIPKFGEYIKVRVIGSGTRTYGRYNDHNKYGVHFIDLGIGYAKNIVSVQETAIWQYQHVGDNQ